MAVQESRVWNRYKEQGYKWLATDKVGGQCVYKNKPITYDGMFWVPVGGWRYVELGKTRNYVDAGQKPVLIDDVLDKRIKPKFITGTKEDDIVTVCLNCGMEFKSKYYRIPKPKFCCRKCAGEYKSKQAMKRAAERIAQKKEKEKKKIEEERKKLQIRLRELKKEEKIL